MLSIDTILHPTDFSDSARNAFEMACSLANQHRAKLLLVHVVSPPPLSDNETDPGTMEDDTALAVQRLEQCRSVPTSVAMEYVLVEGEPAEEIIRVARETKTDLIVMGTQGCTGLSQTALGRIAERVVRDAPCRVITVREKGPPKTDSFTRKRAAAALN